MFEAKMDVNTLILLGIVVNYFSLLLECDGILSDDVVSMDIQELQFLSNMVQAVGVLLEILD